MCHQQQYKYKCPGCSKRTCSLECAKQHKADTGCSGQRDRLGFVPLQDFSDTHLLSGIKLTLGVLGVLQLRHVHALSRPRHSLVPSHIFVVQMSTAARTYLLSCIKVILPLQPPCTRTVLGTLECLAACDCAVFNSTQAFVTALHTVA